MTGFEAWTIDKSNTLYGIDNWGEGYFGVNNAGNVEVKPRGPAHPAIDLHKLTKSLQERDIRLPILIRFNDILRHRVNRLQAAFAEASKEYSFEGDYTAAFPIKVNQQRHIVDVISSIDTDNPIGLEVGSKPELIAVLGMVKDTRAPILCNGYKDSEYIRLALNSQKIGLCPIIIVEKFSELQLILDMAEELNVRPRIGFRLRLAGRGAGRWEQSGGDRAKFGLTISEILQAMAELEKRDSTDIVRLLHFHLGSQITTISSVKSGLRECAQVYAQLKKRAPNLAYCDVGGGLGVDYDGSKTSFESSMNYTVEEYARDVVWVLKEVCEQSGVAHPNIITESGRAMVAYHSVLLFDVLGIAKSFSSSSCDPQAVIELTENPKVTEMAQLLVELTPKNCQETLHDATQLRSDMIQQFNLGFMTIEDRAHGDECFWSLLVAIQEHSTQLNYLPEDLSRLPKILTDTYFCNFSVFQSLPDSWAIEQIFPITPIHRLNEEPNKRVVLADITCDSDGAIKRFADLRNVKKYLPAHELRDNEQYIVGAFLVGAYQEILGDLHNLFGDTNAVHVEMSEEGEVEIRDVVLGDNIQEVLHYVQYDMSVLCDNWRESVERAVRQGSISPAESAELFRQYADSFSRYTYLNTSKD